jgi:hypothetical protein
MICSSQALLKGKPSNTGEGVRVKRPIKLEVTDPGRLVELLRWAVGQPSAAVARAP